MTDEGPSVGAVNVSRGTILLVDDEPADLETLGHVLEAGGYTVLRASNYYQAVRTARTIADELDLLITDVALPGKNGLDLQGEISELAHRPVNVLFISAYSGSELFRYRNIPMTGVHFLQKPFSANDLLARVEDLLANPEPFPFGPAARTTGDDH